jgi:outer membrane protein assembly factor BamB
MNRLAGGMVALLVGFLPLSALGADWPQWQGPNRDAISSEKGLRTTFPPDMRPLWTATDCGIGYSGPTVAGQRVYLMGASGDRDSGYQEFAMALDATTGKPLWRTPCAAYDDKVMMSNWGHGPRSTMAVADERLYGIGANGDLVCLIASDGRVAWRKSLRSDLGGGQQGGLGKSENVCGFSESPLVDSNRLICTPGGEGGTLAALDAKIGDVAWRSRELTDLAGYSSVVAAQIGGVRQYVVLTPKRLAGIRAEDGRLLWQAAVRLNNIAVVFTPIVSGDTVYISSAYNAGCSSVRVTNRGGQFEAEIVYANRVMRNHHGGAVLLDGHVYGWSGDTDSRGQWVCQEFASGQLKWSDDSLEAGSVVGSDGHFYCFTQDEGILACVRATPRGWEETGKFVIPRQSEVQRGSAGLGRIWTHPVIANGRLYLRDQDLLFCYDLVAPAVGASP